MKPNDLLGWMPLFALLSFAIEAQAQGYNRDELRQFGGTYMSACGNNGSLRVAVLADTEIFGQGNRRVAGTVACIGIQSSISPRPYKQPLLQP